ncbi:methyltransferase domain-containing protein [bacterium]|nr:MAG: methyltransferase domain-containing protein [bacterium]
MKSTMVEATHPEDKVKAYYHWRASNYDAGSSFEIEHHLEAIQLAEIQEGWRVLDVACGTGRATLDLAKAIGTAGQVDALDLSEDMLNQARAKLEKAGLNQRVVFTQGNARALSYPDGIFDVLYNGYMFDLIPVDGFLPILKEFLRVLKPGGKIVLVNMSKPDSKKTFYETIYEKGVAVMPCRPVLMGTFLEEAGFSDVTRLYRRTHGLLVSRLWGTEIISGRKPA